ncbi:hypothetical protein Ciccas_000242 [Cichlidogyrus casuarinus]|uniref:beta-N-acetylhexosaminidase n=1 Tax=Cichlidogyrus casuarinus TaxID=1844966 RepID=A0ABD2QNL4_9PLAT
MQARAKALNLRMSRPVTHGSEAQPTFIRAITHRGYWVLHLALSDAGRAAYYGNSIEDPYRCGVCLPVRCDVTLGAWIKFLSDGGNTILYAAAKRYEHIIRERFGLSTYAYQWRHDETIVKNARTIAMAHSKPAPSAFPNLTVHSSILEDYFSPRHLKTFSHTIEQLVRSKSATLPPYISNEGLLTGALVHVVRNSDTYPFLEMDESYALTVNQNGIYIYANETWGALRALETLSQLFWTTHFDGSVFINCTTIFDKPRFQYRGLLIDTARHFISKNILLRNLDAMSYSKLNVFHWHFYDDQAFSIRFPNNPELAEKGAYRGQFYTTDDVAEIIEYARLRGIRVVPEMDLPDHTMSISKSHPEAFTKCQMGGNWDGYFGPMDPTMNATYALIDSLLKDVMSLFPDLTVHLGGDEVDITCWLEQNWSTFQRQHNISSSIEILTFFYARVRRSLHPKKHAQYWQEVVDEEASIPPNSIVQVHLHFSN